MLINFISIEIPIYKQNIKIALNISEGIEMILVLFSTIQMCLLGEVSLCGDAPKLIVNIKT